MQDPNPTIWGTLDKFQLHFIVNITIKNPSIYVAKTKLITKGHFGSKKLIDIQWIGNELANVLNNDKNIHDLLLTQSLHDTIIFIEPITDVVRIYGKWKNEHNIILTKELFDVYNNIAAHIKSI